MSAVQRVLAIDPGPLQSAFVLYEHARDPMTRRNTLARPILQMGKVGNEELRASLYGFLDTHYVQVINGLQLCIEKVESFGMVVGEEVFETVRWAGRFEEAWKSRPVAGVVARVPRMEVKMHLCHHPRAKDQNIRRALVDRFGPPGTKKAPGKTYGVVGDIWSALAVAVTVCEGGHVEQGLKAKAAKAPRLREADDLDDPRAPLFP